MTVEGFVNVDLGLDPPSYIDPMEDPVGAAKQRMKMSVIRQKMLKKRFPDLPLGDPDPKPTPPSSVSWYGTTRLFCVVYGAPRPRFIKGMFWHSRDKVAWDWVKTVKDVDSIKIPRWEDEPEVKAMFRQREILEKAFLGQRISIMGLGVKQVRSSEYGSLEKIWNLNWMHYPNFIDMGPLLLGNTRFFRILVSEPELAHALLEKCFEISTSYADFMVREDGFDFKALYGLMSLGGDYSATLSPNLFAEYSRRTWCKMVINHFRKITNRSGDPPCTIHSCGPSTHLYGEFSQIPNVESIDTRGIAESIKKLREALPNTYLHITWAPPHVYFEALSPEEVRSLVWKFAEGAGFRNILLHVAGTKCPDENVRAFYQTLQEINDSA